MPGYLLFKGFCDAFIAPQNKPYFKIPNRNVANKKIYTLFYPINLIG
jgi:hypothetical protein